MKLDCALLITVLKNLVLSQYNPIIFGHNWLFLVSFKACTFIATFTALIFWYLTSLFSDVIVNTKGIHLIKMMK